MSTRSWIPNTPYRCAWLGLMDGRCYSLWVSFREQPGVWGVEGCVRGVFARLVFDDDR